MFFYEGTTDNKDICEEDSVAIVNDYGMHFDGATILAQLIVTL